jgi:hypothetical protein
VYFLKKNDNLIAMDKEEIRTKTEELRTILAEYRSNLEPLEKELLEAVQRYQDALKEEKLKEIRKSI